jgi:thymidylate synthase (FAD)
VSERFPSFKSDVFQTARGAMYLRGPGVCLISQPQVDLEAVGDEFLSGFADDLGFESYNDDIHGYDVDPSSALCKFAGQLCYLSFGENRTKSTPAGLSKYFDNIKHSGHGSVLEHANFSFLIYGVSRSFTHELVRHRSGMGYSQVSQRYVNGDALRFVERLEFQGDPFLHGRFEANCDSWSFEYEQLAEYLTEIQSRGAKELTADSKRDLRKKVNQVARENLPNAAEAPIVVTGNARAWRHILEMRASEHAEVQIRRTAMMLHSCLLEVAPKLFEDYEVKSLADGTQVLSTKYRKV